MKLTLERLQQAADHLKAIDDYFCANDPEYRSNEDELAALGNFYYEFSRELYAGGRIDGQRAAGNRYHRGMMLSDILTYSILGRGFYSATISSDHRKAFIKIVMRIVNKLLLQENISTNPPLRRGLLETVSRLSLQNFFEDERQRIRFEALLGYDGEIIWGQVGTDFYKTMDSHLPKSRGLAIELMTYLYLIHKNFGFIVPLLIHQRLLTATRNIAPPDFLIIKPDGRVFGIEVGYLKEGQSTEFVTRTSIPTVASELDQDQPFRCPECNRWIAYCKRIINSYSEGVSQTEPVQCSDCENFTNGSCSDIIFYGKNPTTNTGNRRYHYRCIRDKEWVQGLSDRDVLNNHLQVWYPTASRIDSLIS